MKKFLCIIAILSLMISAIPFAASAADGVEFAVSSVTVCPGSETAVVELSVSGDTKFASAMISLTYNENVLSLPVQEGEIVHYGSFNGLDIYGYGSNFTLDGVANADPNGTIINLKFAVDPEATSGVYDIKISVSNVSAWSGNASFENVAATAVSGSITLAHTPGAGATCTEAQTCTECGAEIAAGTGHSFTNYVSNNDASYGVDGTKTAYCDYGCGASDTIIDEGSALDGCEHSYDGKRVIAADRSSCTEAGRVYAEIFCTLCGDVKGFTVNVIPASGHYDYNNDELCDDCGESLAVEHKHDLKHTAAKAATCFEEGNLEYWYCAGCDCYFTDAEGKYNIAYLSLMTPVAHKIEHVAAVEPTATENGNLEYWYCTECGYAWLDEYCTRNTNLKAVILPATGEAEHVHTLEHTEAKAATCFEEGNLEYWYCAGCNCFFTDAEGKYNIAYLSLMTPVAHKVEHVAAKAGTCFEEGNIEYWYCTECHYAWLDEYCTKNTNLKAVILPVSHKIEHVAAVAPTATETGNIEYWFCTECGYAWLDELCIRNTNLKAVILPATGEVINPPTGDATVLYVAAVAVIATLGVAVFSFKKREEN